MICQNTQIENIQNQFSNAIRELQIGKILRKANIKKAAVFLLLKYFNFYSC